MSTLRVLHPLAGAVALGCIVLFWTSTVVVELVGAPAHVVTVKTWIPSGLLVLVPALALTGASGFRLGRHRRHALLDAKRRRMRLAAATGVFVLIPAALVLAAKAEAGSFDTAFSAVQGVELVAGALNAGLVAANFRDGRRLRRAGAAAA